jgi:hypothetical protein
MRRISFFLPAIVDQQVYRVLVLSLFIFLTQTARAADVLFIGDSHSYGCFGQTLDKSIRQITHPRTNQHLTALSSATCGSSSSSWLQPGGNDTKCGFRFCDANGACRMSKEGHSPSLMSLLAGASTSPQMPPSTVIVELGSNMLKANLDKTMKDVTTIIQNIRAKGSACIWIGPPQPALFFLSKAAYEHFVQTLSAVVSHANCQFVDSNTKTSRQNLNDPMGLHYSCRDATHWAEQVFREISPSLVNHCCGS